MKVLFVGEGPHDVGGGEEDGNGTRVAGGVVPALSRKVVPGISADSRSLYWSRITRLHPTKKGFRHKVAAATLLATRRFGLDAVVCVVDNDNDEPGARLKALEVGASERAVDCPVAVGVAIESIEAWLLGDHLAIAEALEIEHAPIEKELRSVKVESLYNESDKPEKKSKPLVRRILSLANQEDGTLIRGEIAARVDIARLCQACPAGFAPFVESLRAAFGAE